jgi:4-hydroxy-tetrahydrodipicolinate synthase
VTLGGVLVPLVTPLTESGEVSVACVAALVESVRPHAAALLPGLSTGEGLRLSQRQWSDMLAATVEHARGLPVIAGVLLPDAARISERVAGVADHLHGVAVAPPFRSHVSSHATQDNAYAHFSALRSATAVPILVYNESHLSGVTMNVQTIRRVCELGGVVAIKDSSGRIDTGRQLAATAGVPVFQGWERLLADSAPFAGSAVGLANLEPALCARTQREPSARTASAVADAVRRYGLDGPTWYRSVKRELVRRGVIRTSAVAGEAGS